MRIRSIINKKATLVLLALMAFILTGFRAEAKEEESIKKGIFADSIELSGMSAAQAETAIEDYVESLQDAGITLIAADGNEVEVTAGELGINWANPQLVEEALHIGTEGNIIERYKILKDLEYENKVYKIEFDFDRESILNLLNEKGSKFDQEAVNASLKRENGAFKVVAGQKGYKLEVESSADIIYDYLTGEWDHGDCRIELNIVVDEPQGSKEELEQVQDVLGSSTTSYSSSGANRSANVANGCNLIDGITLLPGEEFSTYEAVAPFSTANGYHMAGSYLNGRVVDSLGGGICQVSTTLYNAVLNAELEVTERHNHSMIVAYVDPSKDAAIAESSGKDFRFVNTTDYPIYIEGNVNNKKLTFTIYGKETRSANREVIYHSEVLETIYPQTDAIYPDAGQPIGYIVTESSHTGYKARLWKIVKENGVEVSRTQVNSSSYKMTPRMATVGVASADPNAQNEMMAAIGTGSIDHVKNVIALLLGQVQQPSADGAEAPPQEQPAE